MATLSAVVSIYSASVTDRQTDRRANTVYIALCTVASLLKLQYLYIYVHIDLDWLNIIPIGLYKISAKFRCKGEILTRIFTGRNQLTQRGAE